jgi:superoxide reductase
VETQDGYQMKYFAPSDTPEATLALKSGDEVVGVYAYCNLHGLWKA